MKKYLICLLFLLSLGVMQMSDAHASATLIREDLSSHFKGLKGTFVMYNPDKETYVIYNEKQSQQRLSPCSTFKIYNSLIGLETGVLSQLDELTVFKWKGLNYPYENWNRDQTLSSATKNSVVWYFQELATLIGQERMQQYINDIEYGNRDISGGLTSFWLRSSLRISAIEQVNLLNKLYMYELPFTPANVEIVKNNITVSNSDGIRLMGKTGSGFQDGKWILGWFVGCVDKNGRTYFFATNIEAFDGAHGGKASEITKAILKELNIL